MTTDLTAELRKTGGRLAGFVEKAEAQYHAVRQMAGVPWQSVDLAFDTFRSRLANPDPQARLQALLDCEQFFHNIRIGKTSITDTRDPEVDIRYLGDMPPPRPRSFAPEAEALRCLQHLHQRGVTVALVNGELTVQPASAVNEQDRQKLIQHRAEIELVLADVEVIG
jgi:hypothetical protein